MKDHDIVCTLELAQQLKKVGVPQDSIFKYSYSVFNKCYKLNYRPTKYSSMDCAAFTVSEIIEFLPAFIFVDKAGVDMYLNISKAFLTSDKYLVMYKYSDELFYGNCIYRGEKLIDCLANVLLHLVETKKLSFEDKK